MGVLHALPAGLEYKPLKVLAIETSTTFLFIPIYLESEVYYSKNWSFTKRNCLSKCKSQVK